MRALGLVPREDTLLPTCKVHAAIQLGGGRRRKLKEVELKKIYGLHADKMCRKLQSHLVHTWPRVFKKFPEAVT